MKEFFKKMGSKVLNVAIVLVFKFLRTKASMDKLKKSLEVAKDSERIINEERERIMEDVRRSEEELARLDEEVKSLDPDAARKRLREFLNKDGGA